MNYPKLINRDLKNSVFEYDGGDLWVRENVSFWDDQEICWDNDILDFIREITSIKNFLWKINYTIPYGTCELNEEGHLKRINEKPEYDFLVNTGLYVVNPDILYLIPKNKLYHITHLIEDIKNKGKKIGVYPIDDDAWIDVGQWAEYQKAVERL